MENILKPKGMLCNVKWINEQIVIEQKKTVICYIFSSFILSCLLFFVFVYNYVVEITMIDLE